MIFGFLILNHFIACMWFYIGRETGNGWFQEQQLDTGEHSVWVGYMLALHWSITQFHGSVDVSPGNVIERIAAVAMLVVGLMTFSIFVSITTNMILHIRQARR